MVVWLTPKRRASSAVGAELRWIRPRTAGVVVAFRCSLTCKTEPPHDESDAQSYPISITTISRN